MRVPTVLEKSQKGKLSAAKLQDLQRDKLCKVTNQITVEIFGIEPLSDDTLFDKVFQDISTRLQQETIAKFSDKFLKRHLNKALIFQQQVYKSQQSLPDSDQGKQALRACLEVPFVLNDDDVKYVRDGNKKVSLNFSLPSVTDNFYFLQILRTDLQSFLVPAVVSDEHFEDDSKSEATLRTFGQRFEKSPSKFGSVALEREIGLHLNQSRKPSASKPRTFFQANLQLRRALQGEEPLVGSGAQKSMMVEEVGSKQSD